MPYLISYAIESSALILENSRKIWNFLHASWSFLNGVTLKKISKWDMNERQKITKNHIFDFQ